MDVLVVDVVVLGVEELVGIFGFFKLVMFGYLCYGW